MDKVVRIFELLFVIILLQSCGADKIIFHGTKFTLTKEEKEYRPDSLRIVKVVDNRQNQGYIIGHTLTGMFNKKVPVLIDKPLAGYLKDSFNSFVVKDSTQISYIPVTVSVNGFETSIVDGFWGSNNYHKYSYLFEYPGKSKKPEKLLLMDSILGDADNEHIQSFTKSGIRNAAKLFISYFNYMKIDSLKRKYDSIMLAGKPKPDTNVTHIDSIDIKKYRLFKIRSGAAFSSYQGINTYYGARLTYLGISNADTAKFESVDEIGLTYSKLKPGKNPDGSSFMGLLLSHKLRYNLSDNNNGFFLEGGWALEFGSESLRGHLSEDGKFYFGTTIEEGLGVYLLKGVSLSLGSYQTLHIGSKLIPWDVGFVITLGISGMTEIYL